MGVIGGGVPGVLKFKESHIYRIYGIYRQAYGTTTRSTVARVGAFQE
jgi:hypothetical protein